MMKYNTLLRNSMMGSSGFLEIMTGATLSIWSGEQPVNADSPMVGDKLLEISDLQWSSVNDGTITKSPAQTWSSDVLVDGIARSFKIESINGEILTGIVGNDAEMSFNEYSWFSLENKVITDMIVLIPSSFDNSDNSFPNNDLDFYAHSLHTHNIYSTTNVNQLTTWSVNTRQLHERVSRASTILTKNRAFVFGGLLQSEMITDIIQTSLINNDGSLAGWELSDQSLPHGLFRMQSIVTKNKVFLIGGRSRDEFVVGESQNTATVLSAEIQANGKLGLFTNSNNDLPLPLTTHRAFATKSRVYIVGGSNVGTSVLYSEIDANGSLSGWNVDIDFPKPKIETPGVFVTQTGVFIIGGYASGDGGDLNTIYHAPIDVNGVVGSWVLHGNMSFTVDEPLTICTKNAAYLLTGYSVGEGEKIYRAEIVNGSIGTFTQITTLPISLNRTQCLVTKSKAYLLGNNQRDCLESSFLDGWSVSKNEYIYSARVVI